MREKFNDSFGAENRGCLCVKKSYLENQFELERSVKSCTLFRYPSYTTVCAYLYFVKHETSNCGWTFISHWQLWLDRKNKSGNFFLSCQIALFNVITVHLVPWFMLWFQHLAMILYRNFPFQGSHSLTSLQFFCLVHACIRILSFHATLSLFSFKQLMSLKPCNLSQTLAKLLLMTSLLHPLITWLTAWTAFTPLCQASL